MDPASRVDVAGQVLAAFPVWTVTLTSASGAVSFVAATVPHDSAPARVVSLSDILRVSRRKSRGSLTCVLEALPSSGVAWWEAFDADDPLEGSSILVEVDDGTVQGVAFQGAVDEVQRIDGAQVTLQAREGPSWADQPLLAPITSEDWPHAPTESLGRWQPYLFGNLDDFPPILVDDDLVTTLEGSLTSTGTDAVVASTAGFPSSGSLTIDEEELTYALTTPTSFRGLVRGVNGTVAASHAPGASVIEAGPLTYLVAGHALWGAGAVTNLRVETEAGELVPLPDDVTPTVLASAPARIQLDRQPVLFASVASAPGLAFVELDTVAHSDLTDAEAAKALALVEGFEDTNHADLEPGEGTGGQRTAAVELPTGGQVSRAWVVVESFGAAELVTSLTGALSDSATGVPVASTAGFPSSGTFWLESGSQQAELCSYTSKTAGAFLGVTRGVNSDHQAPVEHPSGARVSVGTARVHLDLAGDDADDANALGDLQVKPTPPEEVACDTVPGAHAFSSLHTHTLPPHSHAWDSLHSHLTPNSPLRVDGFAVCIKLGQGGGTGSPVAQGVVSFGTIPEMVAPDVAGAHDITHTNLPSIAGGYDRTNWWAVLFPSEPFKDDTRRVIGADVFMSVSYTGTGTVQQVHNGVPTGAANPATPPDAYAVLPVVVPPDRASTLPNAGGEVMLQGNHGRFENGQAITAVSPANGGTLDIDKVFGSVSWFEVWGRDAGPDDTRSLPIPQSGYLLLDNGADQEWIGYSGAVWTNTTLGAQEFRLSNIERGMFGTSPLVALTGDAEVTAWPARHTVHRLAWSHAGVGNGGITGAGNAGTTVAQLVAQPGVPSVLQTRVGLTFAAHELCLDPTAWQVTVEEFMRGGTSVVPDSGGSSTGGSGSAVPFDETSTDIDEQYGGSDLVVPRAPVVWVRAHTNLQVHAVWMELILEDATSDEEVTEGLPEETAVPDAVEPLGTSTLTWFDVSDLVSSEDDLVGATVKVVHASSSPLEELLVLRMFHALEVQGTTTTVRELPKRLVCDVQGAGVTGELDTCTAAEALGNVPVSGLGLSLGAAIDVASFTATDALAYQDVAMAVLEQGTAAEIMEALADTFRITLRWGLDGKLGLAYRPDRDSLGSPSRTITADDVARSSLSGQRLVRGTIVDDVTVRAGVNHLDGGTPLFTASSSVAPAQHPYVLDAPALINEADAQDLADHVIDYNADVPDRLRWRGFVDSLDVLPGDLLELDHPDKASQGVLVERVGMKPSYGFPGFVTIEGRDLTPP